MPSGPSLFLALPVGAGARGPFTAGEESKPAAQIFADAKAAMLQAKSFHVLGHDDQQGGSISLNVSMSPGRGGGSIAEPGVVMELVLAKGLVYIKADQKSWFKLTGSEPTAALVANRWIDAPVTNTDFSSFAELADSQKFIDSLTGEGHISKVTGTSTWEGRKTVVLVDGTGSKLYIADVGAPYMLYVQDQGSAGALKFSDFGDAPIPAIPTNAIRLPGT